MDSKGINPFQKKLLYISLFIVPFLIGMALIFMGKGIGTLPTLHQTGTIEIEGKKVKMYYAVPEFVIKDFTNGLFHFSSKDSSIFLITLFDKKNSNQWEKHMMYITKIFQRYNNVKILSIYEGNPDEFKWAENPVPYFKQFPKWITGWVDSSEFREIVLKCKATPDSLNGMYPYIIVDKAKHIRTYCDINDLKASRDIPKLLKILNNQYAPRRVKVTQKLD